MENSLDSKPFYLSFGIFIFLVVGTLGAAGYINFIVKTWSGKSIATEAKTVSTTIENKLIDLKASYYGVATLFSNLYTKDPESVRNSFYTKDLKNVFGIVNYVALVENNDKETAQISLTANEENSIKLNNYRKTSVLIDNLGKAFKENKPVFFSIENGNNNTHDFLALLPVQEDSSTFIYVDIGYENLFNSVFRSNLLDNGFALEVEIFESTNKQDRTKVFSTKTMAGTYNKKAKTSKLQSNIHFESSKLDLEFSEVRRKSSIGAIRQIPFVVTIVGLVSSIGSFAIIFISLADFKERYKRHLTATVNNHKQPPLKQVNNL